MIADITGGTDGFTCEGCHELDRAEGEFGTSTNASFENEPQVIKVAHLRNVYQKIGMFGSPQVNETIRIRADVKSELRRAGTGGPARSVVTP